MTLIGVYHLFQLLMRYVVTSALDNSCPLLFLTLFIVFSGDVHSVHLVSLISYLCVFNIYCVYIL